MLKVTAGSRCMSKAIGTQVQSLSGVRRVTRAHLKCPAAAAWSVARSLCEVIKKFQYHAGEGLLPAWPVACVGIAKQGVCVERDVAVCCR